VRRLLDELNPVTDLSDAGSSAPPVELGRLIAAVRRRWRWCALGTFSALMIAAGITGFGPSSKPEASVTVAVAFVPLASELLAPTVPLEVSPLVLPTPTPIAVPTPASGPVDMGPIEAEAALCSGATVADPTAAALHTDSADLLPRYSCTRTGPGVLEIDATGVSGKDAERTAQALADTYVSVHVSRLNQALDVETSDLVAQRTAIDHRLADLSQAAASTIVPEQGQFLFNEQQSLVKQGGSVDRYMSQLRSSNASAIAGTRLLGPAYASPRSLERFAEPLGVGLVLGLVMAVGAAVLAELLRPRPVRRRDVAAALGAPVLADIARTRSGLRTSYDVDSAASLLRRLVEACPEPVAVLGSRCPAVVRKLVAAAAGSAPQADRWIPPIIGSLHPQGAWVSTITPPTIAVLLVAGGRQGEAMLRSSAADLHAAGVEVVGVFLVDPLRHDQTYAVGGKRFHQLLKTATT